MYIRVRDMELDGMSIELICYVKQLLFLFNKFYDFFCRRYSMMNRPCYENFFQFVQHGNFRNLNRVNFIHWKHLQSRVNASWYCFPVIKQYTFHYWWNRLPFQETRVLLKYCICMIYSVIKVQWYYFLVLLWF